jgi:putative toxin-antitoxin system antitoxin component (TIGR02293 family)
MSVLHQQIADWLGVQRLRSEGQVLQIVEQQLPTSAINKLLVLGLTRHEIDTLVIPLRTLQHRRSKREKLTVEESDRVLRVVRLLSQAEMVYGSRERALDWLRRPITRLDKRTPLDLMRTDTGARIVEEVLVQIDEGMFV